MFTKQEVLKIIEQKICSDHKLGEQTGGSGHEGSVDYKINDFKTEQISPEQLEITYSYTISIVTEFTYYPDNPPMEFPYHKKIIVNRNKEIVSEKPGKEYQ